MLHRELSTSDVRTHLVDSISGVAGLSELIDHIWTTTRTDSPAAKVIDLKAHRNNANRMRKIVDAAAGL